MAISLRLDAQVSRQLSAVAKARGISKSALIRQCLGEYLAGGNHASTAWELGKNLFGCYRSGQADRSVRAAEIAKERIHARRAKKSRR